MYFQVGCLVSDLLGMERQNHQYRCSFDDHPKGNRGKGDPPVVQNALNVGDVKTSDWRIAV